MYTTHIQPTSHQYPSYATSVAFKEDREDGSWRNNDLRRIILTCVAGTCGLLTPGYLQASAATSNWSINQIEIHQSSQSTGIAANTASGDISIIRQALKISITEIAKVCGVSRQAVYEWIKGSPLSEKNAQRIANLGEVATVFTSANIEISPQMLRRKINGDQSILSAIMGNGKADNLARQLVVTLLREAAQRQRLASRLAGREKSKLDSDKFGSPHFNENA